jgi:hypothetical protein
MSDLIRAQAEKEFIGDAAQLLMDEVGPVRHASVLLAAITAGMQGDLDLELKLHQAALRMCRICDEATDLIVRHGGPAEDSPAQLQWMESNCLRLKGEGELFAEFYRLHQMRLLVD